MKELRFAGLLVSAAMCAWGAEPAFDVASIKPTPAGQKMSAFGGLRHGLFTVDNVSLRQLLAGAYGVSEARISGPDWLGNEKFDIVARAPQGVPDTQVEPMLRALLRDRFGLAAHFELKEMPVYYLDVAKGGVKMPVYPADDGGSKRPEDDPFRGFPMMRGTVTTARLAIMLSRIVERPIVDRTGLTERYSMMLSFAPFSQQGAPAAEFGPPDLLQAVQQQLGLKLLPGRDQVQIVVVDRIEHLPAEN